jgi:hypothetical protein
MIAVMEKDKKMKQEQETRLYLMVLELQVIYVNGRACFKNVNNCWNTNISFYSDIWALYHKTLFVPSEPFPA